MKLARRALGLFALFALLVAGPVLADEPGRSPPPAPTQGTLYVISRPWSNVRIDGRRVGPTPVRASLAPGLHRVELRTGDGQIFRDRIVIRAGQTVRIMHRFRQ